MGQSPDPLTSFLQIWNETTRRVFFSNPQLLKYHEPRGSRGTKGKSGHNISSIGLFSRESFRAKPRVTFFLGNKVLSLFGPTWFYRRLGITKIEPPNIYFLRNCTSSIDVI